jgi:GPH family glycoside/pentoside/hexuronide:cation symporter
MANIEPQPKATVNYLSPKLTLPVKLAYGAGDFGAGLTSQFLSFFLLIFLTDVAGMRPVVAGSVLAVGKIWDAVNDPLVGMLSDRTNTRWGRRYPWIFLTAVPFGLTYAMIWIVPGFEREWMSFWYYVGITAVFQMFFTTTNLPYSTLTAEMTQDYDERTSLTSFRLAFSIIGGLLILIVARETFIRVADPAQQYLILGIIGGIVSVVTIYWCIFGTYGYMEQRAKATGHFLGSAEDELQESFLDQLKVVVRNRPFLFVTGIYLFSWLALQITAAVIPFYGKYWMGIEGSTLALIVQGVAVIMMFVCAALSNRIGKKNLYFLGSGIWILVQVALFFLQPGQTGILFGLCAIAGFGVATAYVVPWSILPDVIELDELNTGRRREGTFYAFMTLLQKIGLALGIYLVGLALEVSGFDNELVQQSDSALTAIRFFAGPVPLVLLICGMILVYFYPLTREMHAEIMLKLAERKRLAQTEQRTTEGN